MSDPWPELEIRPIQPEDKAELASGMQALSDESRALRFFASKERLSGRELRYLTEVDGHDHVALVAIDRATGRRGVAVARFIRLGAGAEMAEAAIVVVDDHQRRGVGRKLFAELAAVAVAHGVHWFRCEVLPQNLAMRRLIATLAPEVRIARDEGVLVIDVPLTDRARAELSADRSRPAHFC